MHNELSISDRILCIKKIDIFRGLTVRELAAIAAVAEEQKNEPPDVIVREGETGETFFMMIEGEVSVIKNYGTERQIEIDRMRGYDYFGEMAQLENGIRSVSVRAEEPSRFLVLEKSEFYEISRNYPQVMLRIAEAISSRIRRLNAVLTGSRPTVS